MFKSPFSFEGRIRRTEYGISAILYSLVILLMNFILGPQDQDGNFVNASDSDITVCFLLLIPSMWFMIAQACKRCHDRGNSGWWQLIPFYGFWLLFADSMPGINQYGENPKGIGSQHFDFEERDGHNAG